MKVRSKVIFSLAVCVLSFNAVLAQEEIDNLIKENIDESKVLIGEYASPFMKSFSLGLNQGWYNTAKAHKTFGVDLTVTLSGMFIPDSETSFNVESLGLTHFKLDDTSPGYPNAPTVFGSDETPKYVYTDDQGVDHVTDGPPGIGLKEEIGYNIMPVPIANLGIGLPKNTDLKIRFAPEINFDGGKGSFKVWGVGVMHDIKQHIPGVKLLPFDLSAFVGYTQLTLDYDLSGQGVSGENQNANLTVKSTTIQGLISKKFSVLTLYGGLGYNLAKSNLDIKGKYDINGDGDTDDVSETDPLAMSFSASGPRATAGFRLKLAIFTIHADYTLQKYKALSVGFGMAVR
jgi:hypothetical protein